MKKLIGQLCLFFPFMVVAQNHMVEISSTNDPNEISICIDNKEPNRIIAGANIYSRFSSDDGGLSWERFEESSTFGVWGDPVIIQDTLGSYYYFHLSNVPGGNWIDRIVCQRSDDGGKTFSDGSFFGLNGKKAQDKPWAVVNPFSNEIYVTWTQFDKYGSEDPNHRSSILFTKSNDRGETWLTPIKINSVDGNCIDDDDTVEGAVPAVGPNGEIYVAWSGPNGIVFNRSYDGGITWEKNELPVAQHRGGWSINIEGIYRANGMPVTKCDLSSGDKRGTIYINWAAEKNGQTDIYLTKSKDHGDSWSKPIKVNQDESQRDQFFTWMDIDQTNGNLWFVYHDRRHTQGTATDVYLAHSPDGGGTFKELKLTESPFTPRKDIFFGDYNNVMVHNNVVRPVWTRLDDQSLSIQLGIIDPYPFYLKDNFLLQASSSANGNLNIDHHLKGKIEVSVFDLKGDLVGIEQNVKTKKGVSKTKTTAVLPDGVYFVEITNGNEWSKGQWIRKR